MMRATMKLVRARRLPSVAGEQIGPFLEPSLVDRLHIARIEVLHLELALDVHRVSPSLRAKRSNLRHQVRDCFGALHAPRNDIWKFTCPCAGDRSSRSRGPPPR